MLRNFLAFLGRYGIFVLAFVVGLGMVLSWYYTNAENALHKGSTEKVFFEVAKGATLDSILKDLEEKKLIKNAWAVSVKIKMFEPKEVEKQIKQGEYELSPGMKPHEIFDLLVSGKTFQRPVTIPPGANINDVVAIVDKTGLIGGKEVERAIRDRTLMVQLDIPGVTPEGYLFPETYFFSRPVTGPEVVIRIVQEGTKHIEAGIPNWKERSKELGFTPYQMLTLASIIEKETSKEEERSVVASVFHNRLRIGMPLQSDPTVIYGIVNFNGNLTKEHLKTPGPYNTYLNTGLPPTPICNPGLDSLKAALYPKDTDYLYFVGKGDGSHHFSSTYREHTQAVNSYQKIN